MSRDEVPTYSTDREARTPSVLIIDDDPLIVALLTGLLTSKDYSVIKCYNGPDALEILKSRTVDLIICDVVMPMMDGYDFLEKVRHDIGSHIPFVFLTSPDGDETVKAKLEKGIDHTVPKPVDPQALLIAVRDAIGQQTSSETITKRDFDSYRRRVVHTLSHEFRTPLSAINIGMELLLEHKNSLDTEKATNLLEAVRRGGLRLERLVKDFLILQQMEAGITQQIFSSHASHVVVSDLIERFMSFRAPGYLEEGVQFRVSDRSEGAMVKVVEANILDCVDRLVSNAVKFSENSKVVELDVVTQGREVRISIMDRGCGIDVKHVEAAFDTFNQINRENREQQGGGMGLSIARRYASAHKGRLELRDREGGGSVVTLVLPVVDSASKSQDNPLMREH